jgi:hypothetical protein
MDSATSLTYCPHSLSHWADPQYYSRCQQPLLGLLQIQEGGRQGPCNRK